MARKKSVKLACTTFRQESQKILAWTTVPADLGDVEDPEYEFWLYDYAVIRLYRAFERLMLECLAGAINNDTAALSTRTGFIWPKHLTDEVCEYVIQGDGYFDFRSRDGLIAVVKRFLPDGHYLVQAVHERKYKKALDQMSALRNFAAHDSKRAKRAVLRATEQTGIRSAGVWLSRNNRLKSIVEDLRRFADEVASAAPY